MKVDSVIKELSHTQDHMFNCHCLCEEIFAVAM